jgi:lipopolysaccharide/colanic/teichoic acid biosynthesis glycosyltransferase
MASRPFDLVLASLGCVAAVPLCLAAAAGIWITDGRPVLYKSQRVGRDGRQFTMYKLRTMRLQPPGRAAITGRQDARVFPFGGWLRRWKIDELPQIINVLLGDMAIVGPRPEDSAIVERCYGSLARETLNVRPGLASPGSIYNFTHGEDQLDSDDVEADYARELLPRKLALDLVYVRRASWFYDMRIIARAATVIVARGCGRRRFMDPPELSRAPGIERELGNQTCHAMSGHTVARSEPAEAITCSAPIIDG